MSTELELYDPSRPRARIADEHLDRYPVCRDIVSGKRVLDMTSGTGYGTSILGNAVASAAGMNVSAASIVRLQAANVSFVVGDARKSSGSC